MEKRKRLISTSLRWAGGWVGGWVGGWFTLQFGRELLAFPFHGEEEALDLHLTQIHAQVDGWGSGDSGGPSSISSSSSSSSSSSGGGGLGLGESTGEGAGELEGVFITEGDDFLLGGWVGGWVVWVDE